MANQSIFTSSRIRDIPVADTLNQAGGVAYSLADKEALAQLICTGTFNNTFYCDAQSQLETVTHLLNKMGLEHAEYIAQLACYARELGYMKDTPALLTAWLTVHGPQFVERIFHRVIDNGKMLRNFVQIMRSGVVGRKSLGTRPKKLIQRWLNDASTRRLLSASVGAKPSLADVIKMVHPHPSSQEKNEFFRWILGHKIEKFALLPTAVQDLIAFREGHRKDAPDVPFELLTSLELTADHWKDIAKNAGWQMTRMNLNTFHRKGILSDPSIVSMIAQKLANPELIANARVLPYQIYTTWGEISHEISIKIRNALDQALEISLSQVPQLKGKTWIFVDVSGSMSSPITGHRKGSTSKMRCIEVASLIASSFLRVNPENTQVLLFDTKVYSTQLNPESSVMENAKILSRFGGGGTACQLPLQQLVKEKEQGDLIIYVSDNESWFNHESHSYGRRSTETAAAAWSSFKRLNPQAKMVCIDLIPNTTTQNPNSNDILNIGGFNDTVYQVIRSFIEQQDETSFWVSKIEKISL